MNLKSRYSLTNIFGYYMDIETHTIGIKWLDITQDHAALNEDQHG